MKSFKSFLLAEAAGANTHMTHAEDAIHEWGFAGIKVITQVIGDYGEKLSGGEGKGTATTLKWDGAPAIFVGKNPENGQFFVSTKSLFNKNPKINYTNADIDSNHSGDLAKKLKIALSVLSKLDFGGKILQGDMMFTKGDISKATIDGIKYITFQPNTLVYAVPENNDLAKEMLKAKLGVVFHTTYTGSTLDNMTTSFGANVSGLKSSEAWIADAEIQGINEKIFFSKAEKAKFSDKYKTLLSNIKKLDKRFIRELSNNNEMKILVNTHINSRIRLGEKITNPKAHMKDFYRWLEDKMEKEIAKVKQEKTKQARRDKFSGIINILKSKESHFIALYTIQAMIIDLKDMIINKLEKVDTIPTFTQDASGYKAATPEGFVAIDKLSGNAVKLVDRLGFSLANFTNSAAKFGKR